MSGDSSDVGHAYEITQYADVVVALFRNKNLRRNNRIAVNVIENREGDTVNVLSHFDLDNMDFSEIGTYENDITDIELTQ